MLVFLCASGLALWACGSSNPTSPGTGSGLPSNVTGVVSGATGLGSTPTTGSAQTGTAPSATSGGLGASASSGTSATAGGGNEVSVSAGGAPFNTVFVSVGSSSSAAASGLGRTRAETVASGFYEISLPIAVTSIAIGLTYASSLPASGFDLLIQVANGSSVGAVTTLHKAVSTTALVEITGIVFATDAPTAGPTFPIDPLPGAIVSTSLDSHTATTDVSGGFDLQTGTLTSATGSSCYTITIAFPGIASYSLQGLWGTFVSNQIFVMSPPTPSAKTIQSCTPSSAR